MTLRIDVTGIDSAGRELTRTLAEIRRDFGPRVLTSKVFKQAVDEYALLDLDPRLQRNLAGGILNRRSGNLASRTRVTTARVRANELSIDVQTNNIAYSAVHEFGGVIRPVNKRALTIPLPAALTPAGVTRKSAGEFQRDPSPYAATFIRRSRRGNTLIFGRRPGAGARQRLVPLFRLVDRVKIPPRRWASKSIEETVPELLKRVREALNRHFRRS